MRRTVVTVALAAMLFAGGGVLAANTVAPHVLSVGDRMTVQGAPLGCRVARLQSFGRRVFIDCRRGGPLAGSYGTLISDHEAMIVRFRDAHTAKVVFQALDGGRAATCR